MPAERITMRQVREILRLISVGNVPVREIARRTGVAPSTVRATIKRLRAAGLTWPLPEGLSDGDLEARLYSNAGKKQGHRRCPEPDWLALHRELKRKHRGACLAAISKHRGADDPVGRVHRAAS